MAGLIVLIVIGVVLSYAVTAWFIGQRGRDDSIYDTGWGWLLPGGFFYKLGRSDSSPRERVWPYFFGGPLDGWLYNSARERRRRELDE